MSKSTEETTTTVHFGFRLPTDCLFCGRTLPCMTISVNSKIRTLIPICPQCTPSYIGKLVEWVKSACTEMGFDVVTAPKAPKIVVPLVSLAAKEVKQ